MTPEYPADVWRQVAATTTDAQLTKILGQFFNDPISRIDKWRAEREQLKKLESMLEEFAPLVMNSSRKPELREKLAGFRRASFADFVAHATRDELIAALTTVVNSHLARSTSATLTVTRRRGQQQGLSLEPTANTVAGVLWLQAAGAVKALADGKGHSVCEECDALFSPRRTDAKFCSAKCRSAFFNSERREAAERGRRH